jgi:hypothetical protein
MDWRWLRAAAPTAWQRLGERPATARALEGAWPAAQTLRVRRAGGHPARRLPAAAVQPEGQVQPGHGAGDRGRDCCRHGVPARARHHPRRPERRCGAATPAARAGAGTPGRPRDALWRGGPPALQGQTLDSQRAMRELFATLGQDRNAFTPGAPPGFATCVTPATDTDCVRAAANIMLQSCATSPHGFRAKVAGAALAGDMRHLQ